MGLPFISGLGDLAKATKVGKYAGGTRVVREVKPSNTLMNNFGTYGRVTRPGNVPGWVKPTRLEARVADRADKAGNPGPFYEHLDAMERGEASRAYDIGSLRTHIATHLRERGIKHVQKSPILRGTGNGDTFFGKTYAPRGGDLEPGHFGTTSTSKSQLLARKRSAKYGPRG
mgnify:CR=1 FL=1